MGNGLDDKLKIAYFESIINERIQNIKEDYVNPIGASHAKTKTEAYQNGMKAGLKMALKIIKGE